MTPPDHHQEEAQRIWDAYWTGTDPPLKLIDLIADSLRRTEASRKWAEAAEAHRDRLLREHSVVGRCHVLLTSHGVPDVVTEGEGVPGLEERITSLLVHRNHLAAALRAAADALTAVRKEHLMKNYPLDQALSGIIAVAEAALKETEK